MQALQTRNRVEACTQTQSLAAVHTLLRAGLGAISFLRNLLPEDNFTSSHFTTMNGSSSESFDLNSSQDSSSSRRNVESFKIMTLTRGYTDEADKILNYLEYGIFDALEKRYLRSFIFAIYLDSKDPTNIVEAYTFNFKYHTVPGTDLTVPIMSLDDDLSRLSLRPKNRNRQDHLHDPVSKAIKEGKTPTFKDVKASVKAMLKRLIHAMNHMDTLPKRRFATFKVYYTDETPLDYEPPNFHAGDADRDKWHFMTHGFDEVPEKTSFGKVDTGHHSVDVSVTSIASYLPSATEHDDSPFAGTTTNVSRLTLTPLQEATISKQQAEVQLEDAETRNIVWDGEPPLERQIDEDADAESEDDLGYVQNMDGIYMPNVPIGIRGDGGVIEPLPPAGETLDEAQFGGVSERVPTRLQEMAAEGGHVDSGFEETQPLLLTPKNKCSMSSSPPGSDRRMLSPLSDRPSELSTRPTSVDPAILEAMSLRPTETIDSEMLGLETQVTGQIESIESFGPSTAGEMIDVTSPAPSAHTDDNGLQCECEVSVEDQSCYCEGGCKRWFHVWCMGYHSTMDSRIPNEFICFDCRLRSDAKWELIKLDLYPQMMSKFKDLTLFRRAIKVAEQIKSFSPVEFHRAFECDARLGGDMIKRLEAEEFVLKETTTLDDMGLTTTTLSKATRSKGKAKGKTRQLKPRINLQKLRYAFNFSIVTDTQYLDYFTPDDQSTEARLLGFSEMTVPRLAKVPRTPPPIEETQTQEETQLILTPKPRSAPAPEAGSKRSMQQAELDNSKAHRPLKKVKISVADGIDLAE